RDDLVTGVQTCALPISEPPPATFAIGRARAASEVAGRAGMRYRDLIPGRQEGALIASQIRIERGGPVPDYVHWHDVRAQVIHCRSEERRVGREATPRRA